MLLDLPLCRFRQLREVIAERRERERIADLRVREVELRWQCSFLARTEEAAKAVADIRLTPDDRAKPKRSAERNEADDLALVAQVRPAEGW